MNESSILHAAQCGGMSIILGDTVHGKHLEEIIIVCFTNLFDVASVLLDVIDYFWWFIIIFVQIFFMQF